MADQTPMANDADISRPSSAPLSKTSSAQSTHPLGLPCVKCKARHRRCDRTRPACATCRSMGLEAECTYPSAALPVTEDRITKKTDAPFPGLISKNASALPIAGDKRLRSADSSFEQTELVNDVVGLAIQNDSNYVQQTEIPQQSPAKKQKISELGSGSAARQSALAQGQIKPPFGTGTPSGSSRAPPLRSISPTLSQDETELRCNLTTEINVQRMKHRNLAAGPLRNIVKLLMKAKAERPSPEAMTDGSSAMPLNDEWREEDDLMRVATVKLEKGGRCSRALLSRFENFLYGPLMSPKEKKMQERIICVEECLSSASAPPTSDHNYLFLHRLQKVMLHPDAYGLDETDSRLGFLCNKLLEAIATNSKLSPSNRKKFAEFLDPDGEIANVRANSPGVKAETPISTRKVPPKPTSPRVPSSNTPGTPSRTTRQQNSVTSVSPSPSHPPPFPSLSLSKTHPPPLPSRSSSLSTTPVESIDLPDDTMSSSFPFIVKRTPKKRVASGSQSSQSNDTASPSMEPVLTTWLPQLPSGLFLAPSRQTPTKSLLRPPERAASGNQLSKSNNIVASAPKRAASGNQASSSSNMIAPAPRRAASDNHSSNLSNIIAPAHKRSASSSQPFNSEIPKKLWNVFIAKQASFLPILNLDQLKVAFALAVNKGNVQPNAIDPTLGLCLAISCHLSPDKSICEPRKWYDAAMAHITAIQNSQPHSLGSFHQQILQIQYLHMVGHLRMAWETLSLAIGRAQPLRMQTTYGGRLAVDAQSLEQVRLAWQFLWMKKLSLALQLGIVDQSFETFYDFPMPMQSQIENNMGSEVLYSNNRPFATYSFFVACASLYKNIEQLITVENDLRLTRMECPIKWLSIVELRDFQELNLNLSSWKNGLPKFLGWKESSIDLTLEEDPIIRRMCLVTHVRYTYFLLRHYRPFFILCLRLSRACNCEMAPHMPGKNMTALDMNPHLALVHNAAMKCIIAAQDIVKTLCASFALENEDDSMFEQLDYLYAASLVLIASRSSPLSLVQRGESGGMTRSATAMQSQVRQVEALLRNYEECCGMVPKLGRRIGRSRAMLDLLSNTSGTETDSYTIVSDNDIRLPLLSGIRCMLDWAWTFRLADFRKMVNLLFPAVG
ncbi:hypothetical protein N7453_010837 [Penicillium expansum]|nr:hypothetical protein N7453_010837 [Penicillium expansum]